MCMTKTNIEHRQATNITRGDLFDTILKLNKKKLEQGNKGSIFYLNYLRHF